jgi:hypothetical protein
VSAKNHTYENLGYKKKSQIFWTTDMKRVSDSWPLFTGHWLLARSMKQEASGQNADT